MYRAAHDDDIVLLENAADNDEEKVQSSPFSIVRADDDSDPDVPKGILAVFLSFIHTQPIIFTTMVLIVAGLLVLGICYALASTAQCTNALGPEYDSPLLYNVQDIKPIYQNKTLNIVLFGDSLINHPYQNNNLAGKMQAYLPGYTLNIQNWGFDGNHIDDLAGRLDEMLDNTLDTYAVIMYWDSDVSDIGEYRMNVDEIAVIREAYKFNLNLVISEIIKSKPNAKLAVSGPEILGEGPLFSDVLPFTYYGKINMLNRYTKINKDISRSYNLPYIDMRRAFLDALPFSYYGYDGCLTLDGEHENERGSIIVAKMFSVQLSNWLHA